MEKKLLLALAIICASSNGLPETSVNPRNNLRRNPKTFSLFSIVQFPNMECMAGSSSTTVGTCLTASECTDKSGVADGNCAAGFGVCCVIATSGCPTIVASNLTYVQNVNYPTGYLPTSSSTCTFTVNKVDANICQLRLDFTTMSGFATSAAATCSDKLTVTGQSGVNPPEICGTNTGYHMYAEFGNNAADTIAIKLTYADLTSTKMFNILLKQIPCDVSYKAPTDCVQYFTGITGSVANYGHGSGDLLYNQEYTNCIRTEAGMCGISWCQAPVPATGSNTFLMGGGLVAGTVKTEACITTNPAISTAATATVIIPSMSLDGISTLPLYGATLTTGVMGANQGFVSQQCGGLFGAWGTTTSSSIDGRVHGTTTAQHCLVSRVQPFTVGVMHGTGGTQAKNNGFRLEYTQVPCI